MSLVDWLTGKGEIEAIGRITKSIGKNLFGGAEDQAKAIANQAAEYKKLTEITKKELAAKKDAEAAEKRRIDEKQIRSLRRSFRHSGFLNDSNAPAAGLSDKLGSN